MSKNNLNELNDVLFETLRGLKDGTVKEKEATAVTNVANSIINNCKTQLMAYKLSKGRAYSNNFEAIEIKKPESEYRQKLEFSLSRGFNNVAEAISEIGKAEFDRKFKVWLDSLE